VWPLIDGSTDSSYGHRKMAAKSVMSSQTIIILPQSFNIRHVNIINFTKFKTTGMNWPPTAYVPNLIKARSTILDGRTKSSHKHRQMAG
jgi:hypothetical protein